MKRLGFALTSLSFLIAFCSVQGATVTLKITAINPTKAGKQKTEAQALLPIQV